MRQLFGDWLMIASLTYLTSCYCATAPTPAALARRLETVLLAPAVYVGTNIFLQFIRSDLPFSFPTSISNAQGGQDEILRAFGINATRVSFPLAVSVNNFGIIASAGFAGAVIYGVRRRDARRLALAAAAVCLYGVLATDSRGPFFEALAVTAFFLLQKRIRTARGVGILLPLSPVIGLAAFGWLANSGVVGSISRANGDIGSGNNRVLIWRAALGVLRHPSIHQLYGWGAWGHVRSGVIYQYAYVFGDIPTALIYGTTHNLALQTIFDTGYVGLAVLVALVVLAIRALERSSRGTAQPVVTALLAMLVTTVLCGSTEALPSYIALDTLAAFVMLLAVAGSAQLLPSEASMPG